MIILSPPSLGIELVSSSARVTSVKSTQHQLRTSGPKDRTPGLPESDKNTARIVNAVCQVLLLNFIPTKDRGVLPLALRINLNSLWRVPARKILFNSRLESWVGAIITQNTRPMWNYVHIVGSYNSLGHLSDFRVLNNLFALEKIPDYNFLFNAFLLYFFIYGFLWHRETAFITHATVFLNFFRLRLLMFFFTPIILMWIALTNVFSVRYDIYGYRKCSMTIHLSYWSPLK